ncbi:MAG: NAD(P)H-dependent oxidoreductase subunit E [Clostridiales bacterium]|nr:NAD(P)H-dependent oxidoreductase subunit E [Clostridiales bacterium]
MHPHPPAPQEGKKPDYSQIDMFIQQYYPDGKNCLIPVLHTAQNLYGHLPLPLLEHISGKLNIPLSEITGVVSFYSFFSMKPRGRHLIRVCLGTACYIRGGKKLVDHMLSSLKIDIGETTEDQRFTLEIARCIGACGLAPAVMIDNKVYKQMSPTKMDALLKQFR